MSEHPNVTVINRMTQAVFESDRQALAEIFTEDYVLHMRGPLCRLRADRRRREDPAAPLHR